MVTTGIIGAGIAGLAAAVRLAVKGHRVTVFEANSYPGGKLSAFEKEGFFFDAGPSLFTMPHYVTELFELAAVDPAAYFDYQRIPVVCHYFWDDGTKVLAHADSTTFAQELETKLGEPRQNTLDFLRKAEKKYQRSGRIFLEKPLHRVSTWLQADVAKALLRLPSFQLNQSMHQVHARQFIVPKTVQLFDRFATYNGSNPYLAPGMLTMIPHFEHGIGTFYPTGGMNSITQAVYRLACDLGVHFKFNNRIDEILCSGDRVSGVRVGEQSFLFDKVVCNMDVFFAYEKLLPNARKPVRVLKQEKSTSALIFYWGMKKSFPELGLHNIFFSNNYEQEFKTLQAGDLFEDPTVYVNITSKYSPEHAPAGGENWFVMVNAPYNRGQNWEELVAKTRDRVLTKLSKALGVSMESILVTEDLLTPVTIEAKTQSHLGALYGISSNNKMAAFLRHTNESKEIAGLYFCGGSVHPGGGIPLCLLSAKITSELITGSSKQG